VTVIGVETLVWGWPPTRTIDDIEKVPLQVPPTEADIGDGKAGRLPQPAAATVSRIEISLT
jgi:hypothetical protein